MAANDLVNELMSGRMHPNLDFPDVWFPHRSNVIADDTVTIATIMASTYLQTTYLGTTTDSAATPKVPQSQKNKLFRTDGATNIWLRSVASRAQTNIAADTYSLLVLGVKAGDDASAAGPWIPYTNASTAAASLQWTAPYALFAAICTVGTTKESNINPLTKEAVATTDFYHVGTIAMADTTSFPTARIFDSGNNRAAIVNFDAMGADYIFAFISSRTSTDRIDLSLARGK